MYVYVTFSLNFWTPTLMCNDAFLWWNSLIYEENDNIDEPSIFGPSDALFIFPHISPILHNYSNYSLNFEDYWTQTRNTLIKLTKDDKCPNPIDNFPLFVKFLYEYREIIKPSTIDSALNYINTFCHDTFDNEFFMRDFQFSISNPELCVETLSELHNRKDERWTKALSDRGFVDRVFDLFVPFLISFESGRDSHYPFRLSVANFLINVLEFKDGVLYDEMYKNFYQRLIYLIDKAPQAEAISFLRIAIRINDKTIPNLSKNDQKERLLMLLHTIKIHTSIKIPILHYLLSMTQYIPLYDIVQHITKNLSISTNELEILEKFALMDHSENKDIIFLVIKAYCRILVQSTVFMRTSAFLLVEFLKKYELMKDIKEWIKAFIRRVFIFIKLSYSNKEHKYIRRAIYLCSILSSDEMMSIEWLKDTILLYATECFNSNVPFIDNFFNFRDFSNKIDGQSQIKDKENKSIIYKKELASFSASREVILKTFPFKIKSIKMVETRETRKYMNKKDHVIDKRIDELDISPIAKRYLYYDSEATQANRQQAIFQL